MCFSYCDMLYKWIFDLFLEKHLLAIYSFFINLWSYRQQWPTFYKQNRTKRNPAYISLQRASLSPNLLMFIKVLSLNSEFNG